MKVAVSGGFGFLGSRVVGRLRDRGISVAPFSRRTGVDIRDLGQVRDFLARERPEVVVNCAAHVGGIAYNAVAPIEVFEDNMLIGFNIVRACASAGVRKLVNVMPNCTYPGVADVYREPEWWQGAMHDTVLTYGMPRKAMWVQCWAYRQKAALDSIHLVLPNLYGPGDHFDPVRSHALGALVKKVDDARRSGGDSIEIWGTGTPIREWGYVDDAAEGVVRAMDVYEGGDVLNIGQGVGYSVTQIAEMIRDAAGWRGRFVYDKSRPDGAPIKVLDVYRMKQVLSWEPPTPISEGIKRTVEWYQGSGRQR
jgi:GDP-L-fucose synthase